MSDDLTLEHSGTTIRFLRWDNVWECVSLGLKNASIRALENEIDALIFEERALNKIPGFIVVYREMQPIVITKLATTSSLSGREVWYNQDGKRRKTSVNNIVLATSETQPAYEKHQALKLDVKKLSAEASAILESMPRATEATLIAAGTAKEKEK